MFWFAQYVYVPYQTPFLIEMGTTSAMVGIVVGAYGLTQFLARMPIGLAADRIGRHKGFIVFGVAAAGLASVLRVMFPNAEGFLAANLLSGLASGMWISFMVLFATYFAREKLQQSTGRIIAANNIGIFCGFLLSTVSYASSGMSFLCMAGALVSGAALVLSLCIREEKVAREPLQVRELITVYKDKRLILFSMFALVQQGIMMSTSMSFTAEAARRIGATEWEIGMCAVVYIIAAVISSYFAASDFASRFGAKVWVPLSSLALVFYCVLVPHAPTAVAFYGVQMFAGISTGVLFSYCTSEAMQDVPQTKRSTAMGYHQALYAIGMTVMPVITGNIVSAYGMDIAFYFLAFTSLLGVLVSYLFYRSKGAYA
jgi:MFS family permease